MLSIFVQMTSPHNRVQQLKKAEYPQDGFDRGICFFFGSFISQMILFKKKGIILLESKKKCATPLQCFCFLSFKLKINRLLHRRETLTGILILQQLFFVQLLALTVLILNIKMRKHCMCKKMNKVNKP